MGKITSHRPLSSRFLPMLVTLTCILFVLFTTWYENHLFSMEKQRVANHAKVVSLSLWSFEEQTPTDYLTLAIEAHDYQEVVIQDEYGRDFVRLEGKPLTKEEAFLEKLGLIHLHSIEAPILFQGKKIGTIIVKWECKAIFLYSYILFCLLLLLVGVVLYLKLIDAKRLLESRVRERTAALRTEIRDREKAEEQLRLQTQRLSGHVQQTPLGVVEWNPDFTIREWNKSAEKIFEYTREEILGKQPFGLILPENGAARVKEVWERLLSRSGGTMSVNTNRTKSGRTKICSWYNTTLTDSNDVVIGVASLVLDITEQTRAEAEMKILQEQLLQAQKMEAVGNMAGGIAHDFNNILQSIIGYTQLILLNRKSPSTTSHRLHEIEKAARRAAELVQQLLTFSRKIEPDLRPLNLNEEILEVRALLDRTIPKMIDVILDLDEGLPDILGDSVQIEQVVLNLSINASHAMEDGGTLKIRTTSKFLDEEYCSFHFGLKPGLKVLLSVSDSGCGMDDETKKRIFEPFFTTKETGKGTGLGLASVYGIVQAHNAHVECSSTVGEGTTFLMYFPAVETETRKIVQQNRETFPGGSETLLVVDDESNIRDIAREMLEFFGYTVLCSASGEEALTVWSQNRDGIDLIILDLNMPGMGGLKCMQELRTMGSSCPVLVSSGYATAEYLDQATELGVAGFLTKPFQMGVFTQTIRKTLDKVARK